MMDDRDLLRHLEEGGADLFDRPEPPSLDLASITGAQEDAPAARRRWQLPPLLVAAGGAACLAIGTFAGAALFGGEGEPAPQVVASTPPPTTQPAPQPSTPVGQQVDLARFGDAAPADATAQANVFDAADGRTVELRVTGLAEPRKGQFYELWVLGEGTKMISLGIVRVDATGAATVQLPMPVAPRRFPVFDLSLEPGDGNPKHSGDSLLRSAAIA